jgi:hypothetical protein
VIVHDQADDRLRGIVFVEILQQGDELATTMPTLDPAFVTPLLEDGVWSNFSSCPLPHARTSLQAQVLINQAH